MLDFLRRGVRMAGIVQPDIIFDHRVQLRGEEPALGLQMSCAFAPVPRDIGQRGIEEDDRLRAHPPVLDEAEAQRIGGADGIVNGNRLSSGRVSCKLAITGGQSPAPVSSVQMAISASNTGGAWDNAKKFIEGGEYGGKGSDAHKAAVVGDTVGDPLKDTSGPSLNIVMKLMAIISLVFARSFPSEGYVQQIFNK